MTDRGFDPHRAPAEVAIGLYPGLVVDDGRVGGRITAGSSRIPLGALIPEALGFPSLFVELAQVERRHGFGANQLDAFLRHLLRVEGELARLLLVLADADPRWEEERLQPHLHEQERRAREQGRDASVGFEVDMNALPDPWWRREQLRAPVVIQLRRCLDALTEETQ